MYFILKEADFLGVNFIDNFNIGGNFGGKDTRLNQYKLARQYVPFFFYL
jgi:hypothetical protein